jgi:hypothetical protein
MMLDVLEQKNDLVSADINYVRNAPTQGEGNLLVFLDDDARSTMQVIPGQRMEITNARPMREDFTLSGCGFQLCKAPTSVDDFKSMKLDPEAVDGYCREIEAFLMDLTGADLVAARPASVQIRIRGGQSGAADAVDAKAVLWPHADFNDESAVTLQVNLALDELRDRGKLVNPADYSRIVSVNIWRCFSPPPQDLPLAVCDIRTVKAEDVVPITLLTPTPQGDFTINSKAYQHSPDHRWYYFRDMDRDEVLVFQHYDSLVPDRQVPHSAFEDPSCPAGVTPRNSIETRATIFFK